ncbi:carboxymuconolactone decarboxylase family protein [Fusibacter sp. JL216-2]|uniref:carboxymuconolactone decarboxylase family protein n=1 Tax=Fusibacter sp. JL216-2 TaxID=3071453 RepID=UPI003D338589
MKKEHKDQFNKEIGWTPPGALMADKFGDDFGDLIARYHHDIWNEEGAIPLKYRYMIALATAIFDNNDTRAKLELRKAINHGASKEELLEVLKQQVWMKGSPTLVQIAPLLQMIDKSFEDDK